MDTQMQPALAEIERTAREAPSEHLLGLCRAYLALVDRGTPEQQGMERTRAHNAVIQQMVEEGIVDPSPHRVLVRWLARYFVQTDFLAQNNIVSTLANVPHTQIMFLRRDSFPPKLESLPPFNEQEEKNALAFYVPVRVTIEPLLERDAHVESE